MEYIVLDYEGVHNSHSPHSSNLTDFEQELVDCNEQSKNSQKKYGYYICSSFVHNKDVINKKVLAKGVSLKRRG
jgi:hypothetical protein